MTAEEQFLRERFVTDTLPSALLRDPAPFYDAFGDDDALLSFVTALWEQLCTQNGLTLADHPFFPTFEPLILEDADDGFCAVWYLELPETPATDAVCAAVVFGSAMDPRVFAGLPVTLAKGRTLAPQEWRLQDAVLTAIPLDPLYQGCNNQPLLFDAPSPRRIDRDAPLSAPERPTAFLDAVVRWCLAHE